MPAALSSLCRAATLSLALLAGACSDVAAQPSATQAKTETKAAKPEPFVEGRYRYGNVIYRVPDKMVRGRQDAKGMVLLNDDHDEDGFGYIYIMPGTEKSAAKPADATQWLQAQMANVLEEDEVAKNKQPVKQQKAGNIDLLMAGQTVGSNIQLHAALVLPTRIEHVYFEASLDEDHPEYVQRMSKRFTTMLGQLEFASMGAKSVIPAPTPGPLQGTFYAAVTGWGLSGMELDHSIYMFSESGRFFKGAAPGASLATLDPSTIEQTSPGDFGHYRMMKNAEGKPIVELLFADGERDELEYEPGDEGSLVLDGHSYMKIKPLPDGARLNNKFTSSFYQSFAPGSVTGGVGGSRSLTLKPDGTFEADRFSFASATFHDGPAPTGDVTGGYTTRNERPKETGTYSIKNELITLTAQDGTVTTTSIYQIEETMILVDGDAMIVRD